MTIYFQGTERETYQVVAGTGNAIESTTAGTFNATFCRASLTITGTAYAQRDFQTSVTSELWFHAQWRTNNAGTGQPVLIFLDSGGNQFLRLNVPSNSTFQMQYWNGAAWTNIGASWAWANNTLYTLDIKITLGASGGVEIYWNNSLQTSGSAALNAYANLRSFRLLSNATGAGVNVYWSQMQIADVSTLNHNIPTFVPSTAGTDTGGTGTNADITETVTSDATFVEFTTAGQKRSGKNAARTYTGTVKGVTVSGRLMRVDATGPQQAKPYVLIGGTRYYGTTYALTTAFADYSYTWQTNPATGVAWLVSEINDANLEIGWEAVA